MSTSTAVEAAVQGGDVRGRVVLTISSLGQVDVAFCLVHQVIGHYAVIYTSWFVDRTIKPTKSSLSFCELDVGRRVVLLVFQKRIGEFGTIHDCWVLQALVVFDKSMRQCSSQYFMPWLNFILAYSLGLDWSYGCQVCCLRSHACFAGLSWERRRLIQIVNSICGRIAVHVVSSFGIHRGRYIIFIRIHLVVAACSSIRSLIVTTMEGAELAAPQSHSFELFNWFNLDVLVTRDRNLTLCSGELATYSSASSSLIRFFYLCYVPYIPCVLKVKHLKLFILRIGIDVGVVILSSALLLFLGVKITSILIFIWIKGLLFWWVWLRMHLSKES